MTRCHVVRPLTEEDRAAWFDWQVNRRRDWHLWGSLERISFPQDCRDANLMLEATQLARYGPAAIRLGDIDCRGWSEGWDADIPPPS